MKLLPVLLKVDRGFRLVMWSDNGFMTSIMILKLGKGRKKIGSVVPTYVSIIIAEV